MRRGSSFLPPDEFAAFFGEQERHGIGAGGGVSVAPGSGLAPLVLERQENPMSMRAKTLGPSVPTVGRVDRRPRIAKGNERIGAIPARGSPVAPHRLGTAPTSASGWSWITPVGP